MHFCASPLSSPVQNELSSTTAHFLSWNFPSQIKKQKSYSTIRFVTYAPKSKRESCFDTCMFWNKLKSRTNFVCEVNRKEDAKVEIGFTIQYETWSSSRKSQHHYSIIHLLTQIENWKKKTKQFVVEKKLKSRALLETHSPKEYTDPFPPLHAYAVNCIPQ